MKHLLALSLLLITACGKAEQNKTDSAAQDSGMGGMQMSMQGMQMIPAMRAHLDSLGSMTPEQIGSGMEAHQDLASRTMDAMGADMRGMGMSPDSAWSSLADSLRQDLAELSGLSGEALKSRMEAHAGRLRRMMGMHEAMMKM